jgi:hypothetical protein
LRCNNEDLSSSPRYARPVPVFCGFNGKKKQNRSVADGCGGKVRKVEWRTASRGLLQRSGNHRQAPMLTEAVA